MAEGIERSNKEAIATMADSNGYFLISCMSHAFSWGHNMNNITANNVTLLEAYSNWYQNGQ